MNPVKPASGAPKSPSSKPASVPVLDSTALFGAASEVRVVHRGAEYRLRITRQGKLILTK